MAEMTQSTSSATDASKPTPIGGVKPNVDLVYNIGQLQGEAQVYDPNHDDQPVPTAELIVGLVYNVDQHQGETQIDASNETHQQMNRQHCLESRLMNNT